MQTITRVYDNYDNAKSAVRDLEAGGIASSQISLMANKTVSAAHDGVANASEAGPGAGVGAVVGGAAGLLAGLGIMAIPGVGPVVAAGWLASTALGAAVGGATGGILGALVDSGVPEDHAHVYSEAVRRGSTLLSVKAEDSQISAVNSILGRYKPIDPIVRRSEYQKTGWNEFDPTDEPYDVEGTDLSTLSESERQRQINRSRTL